MRAFSITVLVLLLVIVLGCAGDRQEEAGKADSAPVREAEGAPAPPPRRMLPEADKAPAAALALDTLERIDLAAGLTNGEVTIAANDPRIQESIAIVVDGDVETMAVSNALNPAELTITLRRPVKLRAARVYLASAHYDWVIEPEPGKGRLLREEAPERTWSQIDLPAVVETSVVRLEILRLERDDFVHVNEVELYAER